MTERYFDTIMIAPAFILILTLMIVPMILTLYLSVHEWFIPSGKPPAFIGIRNYIEIILRDKEFLHALWVTVYYTGMAVSLEVVFGVGLAILLNKKFFGQQFMRVFFLLPLAATPVVVAQIWRVMYHPDIGLLNYLLKLIGLPRSTWVSSASTVIPSLVLIDFWKWTPLIMLITLAGLATVPSEPYESALIDGASAFQLLIHITLPLLRPVIIVATMFRLIDCIKTFDIIFVASSGGPGIASENLYIYIYQKAFDFFYIGNASALIIILLALILITNYILILIRRGR